jgi:hypothetical protein
VCWLVKAVLSILLSGQLQGRGSLSVRLQCVATVVQSRRANRLPL